MNNLQHDLLNACGEYRRAALKRPEVKDMYIRKAKGMLERSIKVREKLDSIQVVETDAPVADSRFMATFGEYDLDCVYATGHTAEAAKQELIAGLRI